MKWEGDKDDRNLARAQATIAALQAVTPPVVVESASPARKDPTPTATPTSAPVFAVDPTAIPATPTPVIVTEYREVYIEVEVTREVEVTPVSLPTATVTPTPALAQGQVKICASVEGAAALYIGGYGVVSGDCQTFSFGVGQTEIKVHINK